MFGLRPAPIFYPTSEEFQDPLAYIQKIRPEAESAGLCKIVPPEGWNPPFALDTKQFRFKTRIQQLNSLEGKTRTNLNYLDQLRRFHSQQGQPMTKVPQLDHRPIDLFGLRHEVAVRGGYQKVNSRKLWAEIGRVMKYDRKTCTSMSNSLKSTYQKIILPFDLYLAKHGGTMPDSKHSSFDAEADDAMLRRSKRQRLSLPKTDSLRSSPVSEDHSSMQSPMQLSQQPLSSESVLIQTVSSPSIAAESTATTVPESCEVCKSGENDDSMLICDGCDRGFHMYCLNPPLEAIPTNDWYCDSCVLGAGADFGFEDGAEYTLEEFKQKCDEFKRRTFSQYYEGKPPTDGLRGSREIASYLEGPQMEGRVPEDVVEEEFWRLVASPYEDVEVEYGADLHSAQHGSGFPTIERSPLEDYARHPWNLNVLPFQQASLFNYIRQDISGMMSPWIYVGMCFSTFCWHNEDHYTYSVNYQHWGDTKTWYGVPGRHADMFEEAMRQTVPQLFEEQPDLLFQLVTMLSPDVLVRRGVDVFTCDQRAGEFVVTFPQSYHAGFNHGFNFNEAVNFATTDWMPYGTNSVQRYQQYGRNPVFSHDELLMTMCEEDAEFLKQEWFQRAAAEMLGRELAGRARVRSLGLGVGRERLREVAWDDVDVGDTDISEDMRQQCLTCKAFSYLSAVMCTCSPNYVSCLLHVDKSCKCSGSNKTLMLRYTDSELESMV
ncbi:JmjC-domain-containing protein, partial [Coemansia reversa NRRL 1564]